MTESSIPDDIEDRYRVVAHGSRFRIQDALNSNDGNGVIYPTRPDAQKWATRANARNTKASGSTAGSGPLHSGDHPSLQGETA